MKSQATFSYFQTVGNWGTPPLLSLHSSDFSMRSSTLGSRELPWLYWSRAGPGFYRGYQRVAATLSGEQLDLQSRGKHLMNTPGTVRMTCTPHCPRNLQAHWFHLLAYFTSSSSGNKLRRPGRQLRALLSPPLTSLTESAQQGRLQVTEAPHRNFGCF